MRKTMDFYSDNGEELKELRLFNTFRIGYRWADLVSGDILDIYLNDNYVGPMLVGAVATGHLGDMLEKHVALNSLSLGSRSQDHSTLVGKLWTELQDVYKAQLPSNEPTVVIYLINTGPALACNA